ncbi:MAG TPA: hypothetical protein DCZ72_01170 [Armatimonadetes bacterium]|nr:hypothetical protein [Armatimonadota bacterium]
MRPWEQAPSNPEWNDGPEDDMETTEWSEDERRMWRDALLEWLDSRPLPADLLERLLEHWRRAEEG